jgi:hypothetical protein
MLINITFVELSKVINKIGKNRKSIINAKIAVKAGSTNPESYSRCNIG